jgi:hypothetical protein
MTSRGEPDPKFTVELGSVRFDPRDKAASARRRVAAGKKRLREALGLPGVDEIPGAAREAYLVQFEDDPDADTVRRLRDEYGLRLTHGMSSITFVERLNRDTASKLRRDRAVRVAVPFSPDLKYQNVGSTAERPSSKLEIGLIEGDDIDGVTWMLEALGLNVLLVNDDRNAGGGLSLLVETGQNPNLSAVAAIDDVAWITEIGEVKIKNLDTAGVAQNDNAASHPVWAHGIHGEGMIIGVIDASDIDLFSKFFRDSNQATPGPNHRKVVENRKAAGSNTVQDPAHGTRTSGCVVADEEGNAGNHPNRGGAWAARVAYGDIYRVFGASPSGSLTAEFESAASVGARIHTNSWGLGSHATAPPYDSPAHDIDGFLWQNANHLCITSAPNPTMQLEGALPIAKNPIVIGGVRASPNQNTRRADPAPLTADSRRKPDLLAVAEDVTTSALSLFGFNATAVQTVTGNSFAAPHVAAAAALVRQYFTEGWYPTGKKEAKNGFTPSGALLKAMLLNATRPLTNQRYPSRRDGWGRLQLNTTLHFDGDNLRLRVWDIPHAFGLDRDGRSEFFTLDLPGGVKSLKVTLVFMDPKGAVGARDPVVNKLDVQLMEPLPSGFCYFGNDFLNGLTVRRDVTDITLSSPPDPDDLKNNVRQVLVDAPLSGSWEIVVHAYKVDQAKTPVSPPFPRRSQGYALVACYELS